MVLRDLGQEHLPRQIQVKRLQLYVLHSHPLKGISRADSGLWLAVSWPTRHRCELCKLKQVSTRTAMAS